MEVGARFSTADLNSGDVRGDRQHVWTAGSSGYPADALLRFVLQYQRADIVGGRAPRSLNAVPVRGQLRLKSWRKKRALISNPAAETSTRKGGRARLHPRMLLESVA